MQQQRTNGLLPQISPGHDLSVPPGALDGVTIMRYAHIQRERASGGVEQYLNHLDHGLLQRHRLTVLQVHLKRDDENYALEVEVENVGLGRILWVPIPTRHRESRLADLPKQVGYVSSRMFELHRQEGKGQFAAMLASMLSLLRHRGGHLRYKSTVLSDRLPNLLATQHVDLLSMHWLSYDTAPLISRAIGAGIPFVFINHFTNARLSRPLTRKWISRASLIGVVSDQGIPDGLLDQCVNLSDAVDTEFFAPEKARPMQQPVHPIVLLPGRMEVGKGHRDLIEAARNLAARRIELTICFVGAVDSESLHQKLRRSAAAMGLGGRILFLGEKSAKEIRDLYAQSSMVVLPSYSEGLARVLLEAQAMKKPVVAYDSGGMHNAIFANKTGFLVKQGNTQALADKIAFLLENDAERLRMGEQGREFVLQRFSLPALVQRHESFYLKALSGARTRTSEATTVDPRSFGNSFINQGS
jgi:glycosyltransferase involved in cell wall biosynthesis